MLTGIKDLQEQVNTLQPIDDKGLSVADLVAAETRARNEAINAETQARQQTINAETQARQQADKILQDEQKRLQDDFNAWNGRGGYLDAFDFAAESPSQSELTEYALSKIPTISDALQIWNGTKVENLYNGILWILTNTQDTPIPIFEWTPQGPATLKPFVKDLGGYIVGADPENDPPEYVQALMNGKGKINLEALNQSPFYLFTLSIICV